MLAFEGLRVCHPNEFRFHPEGCRVAQGNLNRKETRSDLCLKAFIGSNTEDAVR